MKIYCCECEKEVDARLTCGAEIYKHRRDLYHLSFWKCDDCGNYVGCHNNVGNKIKPLGCIPNDKIRKLRNKIHQIIDPIWKNQIMNRKSIYKKISERLGYEYHTANLKSVEECQKVIDIVNGEI